LARLDRLLRLVPAGVAGPEAVLDSPRALVMTFSPP
jgi:hypothetical protein